MKKIVCVMLALCAAVSFAACGNKAETTKEEPSTYERVLINSFEDWRADVDPLVVGSYFGGIRHNTDKKYVTEGEKSIVVTPINDGFQGVWRPYFRQNAVVRKKGMDVSDFSSVARLMLDAYNDYSSPSQVYVKLRFGKDTIERVFELPPDSWTTIDYPIDLAALRINYDLFACDYIQFEFDITDGTQKLYLDNLRLFRYREPPVVNMTYEEGKFLDFDNPYALHCCLLYTATVGSERKVPQLSLSGEYADKLGTTGSALRIVIPAIETPLDTWYYGGIYFSEKVLTNNRFREMRGGDVFSFKVYNDSPVRRRLFVEVHNTAGRFYVYRNLYVEPYSVGVYSATFAELNAEWVAQGNDERTGTGAATKFAIMWELFNGEDAGLAVDDMLLVKAS